MTYPHSTEAYNQTNGGWISQKVRNCWWIKSDGLCFSVLWNKVLPEMRVHLHFLLLGVLIKGYSRELTMQGFWVYVPLGPPMLIKTMHSIWRMSRISWRNTSVRQSYIAYWKQLLPHRCGAYGDKAINFPSCFGEEFQTLAKSMPRCSEAPCALSWPNTVLIYLRLVFPSLWQLPVHQNPIRNIPG